MKQRTAEETVACESLTFLDGVKHINLTLVLVSPGLELDRRPKIQGDVHLQRIGPISKSRFSVHGLAVAHAIQHSPQPIS